MTQAAFVGMMDAIAKYDGSTKFMTYSQLRIRGAISDEARKLDIVPRLTRVRQKKRLKLIEQGLNPEDHMTPSEYADSFTSFDFVSTEKVLISGETKDSLVGDELVAKVDVGSLENDGNFRALCRGCLLEEEVLLYLYYVKDQNMKDIANVLNLSESRVSQMHSSILKRLGSLDLASYL